MKFATAFLTAAGAAALIAFSSQTPIDAAASTVDEVRRFVESAEARLADLTVKQQRAAWVQSTYITTDTIAISAEASRALTEAQVQYAKEAAKYRGVAAALPADLARKLQLLQLQLTLPAPSDPVKLAEVTRLGTSLEADYGRGKYCRPKKDGSGEECLDVTAIERLMAESRDPNELRDLWIGWHKVGAPMRDRYAQLVGLTNEGARELGFADTGALWRSYWDMPPDAFAAEVERLWQQVRPLYESLHAYVRSRLLAKYGPEVVPATGPIPAHLLGNLWSQEWGGIYPVVAPAQGGQTIDLTERLRAAGYDAHRMVKTGEAFFTSLGFAPLPPTFWERSQFVKPADRDVVCHASAWDVDAKEDLRIKMCIQVRDEDFRTVHHELGHNFYQRAYNGQPYLFQGGANAAFHEAIGDTIALSITPEYLKRIGLVQDAPPSADIGHLLQEALDKVGFLPFGVVIDQWRWKVFSGEIPPSRYNAAWWDLRLKYQGVTPPVARSEQDFDPGAKYHVPANYPYTSYFLARILQFQFHRALCHAAGQTGPLDRVSIYGNAAAGDRLARMLQMGASKPWPDALEALTGERRMDATALLEYFAPLKEWLDRQNKTTDGDLRD
jgi:peptidyl-dipeptidase A